MFQNYTFLKIKELEDEFKALVYGEKLVFLYKDGKIAFEVNRGLEEENIETLEDGLISVGMYPEKISGKVLKKITFDKLEFESLIKIKTDVMEMTDKYFENLNKIEIENHNGYWVINTKEYNELERLYKSYARQKHVKWINKNKDKFSYIREGFSYNYLGNIKGDIDIYYFDKDIKVEDIKIKPIKTKESKELTEEQKIKKAESEARYNKLHELAEKLKDEDFEDVTGLPREDFLI